MGLELLRYADMALNVCGRPVPPPGYRFIDLPRVIPFRATFPGGGGSVAPLSSRVENTGQTLFICKGLSVRGTTRFNIKWPSGRELSQNLSAAVSATAGISFPLGTGAALLALNAEQPVEAGGRISVELDDALASTVDIQFLGVLRYLLKTTGGEAGTVSCVVGYPAESRSPYPGLLDTDLMVNPIDELAARQRYRCGPNQNIMAPEFLLGNQCAAETPAGFADESFTFLSPTFTVPAVGGRLFNNGVLIPGDDDMVIKRMRAVTTWGAQTNGALCFSLRLPNGYSITGGDLIPAGQTSSGNPPVFAWLPLFPTLWVKAGDRLILDIAILDGTQVLPNSTISTLFEFDAVKRRRL